MTTDLGFAILYWADCLCILREMPDNSVDSVITDPPYGISFMGRKWDYDVPSVEIWQECLRVLKPGGHLLAFAGTRTQHRMACRIEDAGFEIRDMIAWVYGSGFPKSLDVSRAIDKAAGAEREVISEIKTNSGGMAHISKTNAEHGFRPAAYKGHSLDNSYKNCIQITAPATPEAKKWDGWGTALKPALEPITVARKPLIGTVAENVSEHGTGALNIGGCRIPVLDTDYAKNCSGDRGHGGTRGKEEEGVTDLHPGGGKAGSGRWPANFIHDGSEEVLELFPETKSGATKREIGAYEGEGVTGFLRGNSNPQNQHGDSGSAARFFYCAKAGKKERGEDNKHPTVKPVSLMRYLCRLTTPPGGLILDPFMGSGSTGVAAIQEGFEFVGMEKEEDSYKTAEIRIKKAKGVSDVDD